MIAFVVALISVALILLVLWDAFEAMVLPRRVTRRFRLARAFYRFTWMPYAFIAKRLGTNKRRDRYLGIYGPISLLLLICVWALSLIFGFALLQWALGSHVRATDSNEPIGFAVDFYLSGTTFFTLGLGDVLPRTPLARFVTVVEAGLGFGFLAVVIGYLPVVYGAFSKREVSISLLDARAGSPPTATELIRRQARNHDLKSLEDLLRDWELWASELMESHLSYPVLCYYRSQHTNQSWLAALTTILDACALVIVGIDGSPPTWQAELTFSIARHAIVDISQIFGTRPCARCEDRLPANAIKRMREMLAQTGAPLRAGADAERELIRLRSMYEPYIVALADFLLLDVPTWVPAEHAVDNWQTSAWGKRTARLPAAPPPSSSASSRGSSSRAAEQARSDGEHAW